MRIKSNFGIFLKSESLKALVQFNGMRKNLIVPTLQRGNTVIDAPASWGLTTFALRHACFGGLPLER